MQVVVNGLLIHYETIGKGKPILVLHGWGDDSQSWKQLQKMLGSSYAVTTIDLPGFGASAVPKDDWTLNDYASFLKDFLEKIKAKNIYAIIGHSNGGAIAIRGLSTKVLHAEKLILLGSAGVRNEYKGRNKALRYITKTGKALTTLLPKSAQQSLRQKVYKTVGSDMLVAEHMQGTFKNIVEDDVRKDAHTVVIPTLLIYGAGDTATPPRYGRLFHEQIKGSELKVIPEASHFVYQDKPHEIGEYIEEFLS